MPAALRIFLWSLLVGVASGGCAFKLILYLALRWAGGDDWRQLVAMLVSVAGAVAVGVAGAVTAGVLAGKRARP